MAVKIALIQQPASDAPDANRARGLKAAEQAIEQGATIEVSYDNKKLKDAGSIGAFLRF